MPNNWKLGPIALVVFVGACGPTAQPRLEEEPLAEASAAAPATPQVEAAWVSTWEPSWIGKPDATIVLTGSSCEQVGGAGVLDPGVLTIEFVNEAHLDGAFMVVRLVRDQRLGDVRDTGFPLGEWGERAKSSATDVWSSPREVTSGRWAVICLKDLISAPNGIQFEWAGVAGPIEVG